MKNIMQMIINDPKALFDQKITFLFARMIK